MDAFINWSKPFQVLSRRRVIEEGGQKPPHPKDLFAVEVLCLDRDPTIESVAANAAAICGGPATEIGRPGPSAMEAMLRGYRGPGAA